MRGRFEAPRCNSIELRGLNAPLSEERTFELRLPITEPEYVALKCERTWPLFLAPGDDLSIEVAQDSTVRFSGRGAEVNEFVAEMARLRSQYGRVLLGTHARLSDQDEAAFVSGWDSAYAVLFEPLNQFLSTHEVPAVLSEVERARVLYPWAEGRARYPFRRWISTGQDFLQVSDVYDEYLSQLDMNNARLLTLDEYTSFLGAYVHERARRELRKDPSSREGDNQWTRAKYAAVRRLLVNQKVRNHALNSIFAHHIEHYGSKGLEPLLEDFSRDCTDERFVAKIKTAYQEDRANWEGHDVEVYKSVGGVRLDAHVFRPGGWRAGDRRPALVWFHGGSWYEGAWYWSLGLCSPFVKQGMLVVQIEYRIFDRHNSTPIDAIADAKSAVRWVRANADRLGIDANRIVAAGFSSGGHLAASTAMLDRFDEPDEDGTVSSRPNAVVLVGACVDPTSDPWYRRIVQAQADPTDGSPAHHVRAGLPPMVAIHGTGDRMCPYSSLTSFADRMKEAGNICQVEAFDGRAHFFLWQSREDRAEALARITAFLNEQGFAASTERGDQAAGRRQEKPSP